jgi:hypothetical protein
MDLADIVSRTRQVVLDELSTLHDRNLCDTTAHADAHEVAANGYAAAFTTAATLEGVLVELQRGVVGYRLHGTVVLSLAAPLVTAALAWGPALTTTGSAAAATPASAFASTTRAGLVLTATAVPTGTTIADLRSRTAVTDLWLRATIR